MRTPRRLRELHAALEEAGTADAWQQIADTIDQHTGADAWRADDASRHYDAAELRASLDRLRAARRREDGLALAGLLGEALHRHLPDLVAPALYDVALGGTKRLVDEVLDEAEAALLWLARTPIPGVPAEEKLRRFEVASRAYGRSALLLSGGATLGFHHLGVVKALHTHGLLPDILSGASTGAMIAAGVCTRDDAGLDALFADLDALRLDGLAPVGLAGAWRTGAVLDPRQLYDVLLHNVGDATFAEAHARSGRTLAISVSPTRVRQKPRLLTHLTSPDVLVASAALASSALPGLFPPVVLEARDASGRIVPHAPTERWVDGSLVGDLPKLRLARLHDVNHFVVSQTNPHVLPFVGRRGPGAVLVGLAGATVRAQATWATDVVRRLAPRSDGVLPRVVEQAHALLAQDYGGDIDLHPRFHWKLYRKVVRNPSRDDLAAFVAEGARSVWPRLALIRNQTRLGRALRRCCDELRDEAAGLRRAG